MLHKQGEVVTHVYFPTGGAVSLVKTLGDGHAAEIATIGKEGMVGTHVFFGEAQSPGDVIVQVAIGEICALPTDKRAGLIAFRRGHLTILDRDGLEAACCECYTTVIAGFSRLLSHRFDSIDVAR
jgi:CRP-like cAMP-binding protein